MDKKCKILDKIETEIVAKKEAYSQFFNQAIPGLFFSLFTSFFNTVDSK